VPSFAHLRTFVLLPILALALVAAAAVLGPVSDASAATRSTRIKHATSIALHQLGDPYRYGAAGPRAFDCSGLLQYSFRKAGIRIPRTSSAQARHAHRISKRNLHRGDLMFFTDGGGVYHAALFLRWDHGRALMVHAPSPGKRVRRDHPWTTHWFAARVRG
jgi:cell wall-associated NlpC family hydrolase